MNTSDLCGCATCRRDVGRVIADECRRQRRWMGYYTIRHEARLGWLPLEYFRVVMAEMYGMGLLLRSQGPEDEFARYLHWSLAAGNYGNYGNLRRPPRSPGGGVL